jgi:16S rRNA (cytosine967-C5)-methyltransferase
MPSSREIAISALNEILARQGKPKSVLESRSEELDQRERAFVMELVYGVVRYRDTLDWIISKFLRKPRLPGPYTLNNLRSAVYQLFFMRVPEWASVNEAVTLERKNKGLVNAILRNVIRNRESVDSELNNMETEIHGSSGIKNIALLTSHPEWLIKRWAKRFGPEETLKLAVANNVIPPMTLRVNTLRTDRDKVIARLNGMGIASSPTSLSPEGIRLDSRLPFRELGSLRGLIFVQDEAAQLISRMLGPKPGERVLDACAAPGGKTTHIAQIMKDQGEIIAVDVDPKRIAKLEENLSVMSISSARVVEGDITNLEGLGHFDRILLDAPCSALGTIRRNPDVKYKNRKADLRIFKDKQLSLLR